ncbi:MAG: LTA synthase family protein [Patescibacteria group bacterium]|jgi:phosphoglycerol transferase MdoB-like AlkP superfamily enzyme
MMKKPFNFYKIKFYCSAFGWPVVLALLFVWQNQAYNSWLNIYPQQYIIRRVLVTFSLGIIVYGPAWFFKKRGQYLYLFLVSILISFIFVAQFIYYEYATAFLQVSAWKYASLATSQTGTIVTLLNWRILLFVANLILLILALIIDRQIKFTDFKKTNREKLVILMIILFVGFSGYYYLFQQETKEWGDGSRLYSDLYDLETLVAKAGVINFTLEDTAKYLTRDNHPSAAELAFVQAWNINREATIQTVTTPKYFALAKNRNVIFIEVESLENAVIGQSIGNQAITPYLNELARRGLYFDNYYTQVGQGNTADAEFVTMNSIFPLPTDVVFIDYAHNNYQALPQLLKNNGYHTYALHGDVPTFWNRSNIYPQLGYSGSFSKQDYIISRKVGPGFAELGDEDFLNQSALKLKNLATPFMATLITISSHTPFEVPLDLQTLKIPTDTKFNKTQQNYLQSIHYVDQAIGKFLNQLKTLGLYDNSLIVIYGDHGSYTSISRALKADNAISVGLSDNQVPLIILAPDTNLSGTINNPSSHLDFYPTIANLLGLKIPRSVLGQDILNSSTPVMTRRNSGSGTINSILTPRLAYEASSDGVFERGRCLTLPNKQFLPSQNCRSLYEEQNNLIKASDIIERGNLITTIK